MSQKALEGWVSGTRAGTTVRDPDQLPLPLHGVGAPAQQDEAVSCPQVPELPSEARPLRTSEGVLSSGLGVCMGLRPHLTCMGLKGHLVRRKL